MVYLGEVVSALLKNGLFYVFMVLALGYLLGAVKVKGISLGSAGVLVMALIFGIVSYELGGSFNIGDTTINLYNPDAFKSTFGLVSNIGTALFVTSVGLIAGPKFFRSFNKKMVAYLVMGVVVIGSASVVTFLLIKGFGIDSGMAVGLLTGALTSTPGFSAATEALEDSSMVTSGYAIAYLFGVLGVVLFVQIVPKVLKVNIEEERKSFTAASSIEVKQSGKRFVEIDGFGFFSFSLTVALGYAIGYLIKIPGINFNFGASGGTLIAGLVVGHFGHIGPIDCKIKKDTLNFMRELGLVLFLVGAGVPGGNNFIDAFEFKYLIYGIILTLVPMLIGFVVAKYVFKLSIFNNLGSITGAMTSTPALGSLISVAGTDDVASAYAASYPTALILIVLASKLLVML